MRVASYRTHGLYAGRIVEHRQVQGDQRWRIRISAERVDGEVNVRTVTPAARVPLSALSTLALQAISDCCAPGERLTRASLDFYVVDA